MGIRPVDGPRFRDDAGLTTTLAGDLRHHEIAVTIRGLHQARRLVNVYLTYQKNVDYRKGDLRDL
jgi:hypothetical protein